MKIDYRRPKLYAKQIAFIDSQARYTVVEAATKVGKTVCCLVWLMEQALAGVNGNNYWWIAPIYPQACIAFSRLKRWLQESTLPRDLWRANEGEPSITFANGAKIWFKGADKPDSLYGEDVYAAVMDEASRCKPEAWYAVRSTLTATKGKVKIIGNVRGRKNWAYQIARRAESGEEGYAYFKLTAYDAVEGGVLDLAEVEDAKRALPAGIFQELYLAEASEDGGNPFGIKAIRECIAKSISVAPPACYGLDLAKSHDWTVLAGLDADGQICHLDRWQGDWGQTKRKVLDQIGDVPTLADSTGVGDPIVEDLIREKPNVEGYKFTATSKQQLMEGLAASIHRHEIGFPEGWLTSELEAFEYEYRAGGVRYSAPEGLHDDGVCSLALADRKRKQLLGSKIEVRMLGDRQPTEAAIKDAMNERAWNNF